MKKTIRDFDLSSKKVLIRVDFNVPMKDSVITDNNRIVESLPTIKYALDNNAKVILLSHLGRVKEESDLVKNNLEPVSRELSRLLEREVTFVSVTRGAELEDAINNMNDGDIVLIQNTRYEDLDGKKESKNDPELGAYWASLGDIYINDAFGTCHRAHASNVGIASNLPNGVGFLVEKELNVLNKAINNPDKPFMVILGGSKVSDKINVIENLVKIADNIIIGGGMAFTFLKANGIEIGSSLLDEENIDFCKRMLEEYPDKIILPIDVVVGNEISNDAITSNKFITDMNKEDIGLDIGDATVELFTQTLSEAKTVVWNGPVGCFEYEKFANGTKSLCEFLSNLDATTILGGGDTAAAAISFGYKEKFSHISTGGGASLELLEGKVLSGVDIIDEKE